MKIRIYCNEYIKGEIKLKKLPLILTIILIPFFSFFGFSGCGGTNALTVVRVSEVTHSVFYAPMYIALNNGYFEDEGLDVQISNASGSNNVMTAVISGQAEIGLAGPETVVYNAVQGNTDKPTVFGQLTACDGSFLIGRTADPDFELGDLAGKTIVAGRRGGMPAMTLQYALHSAGLEAGTDYTLNLDVDFGLVAGAFEGGTGDYCTMFEPTASAYVSAGKGSIVASIGELGGSVPYTAFIANQKYLTNNSLNAERFLRAIYRGYNYLINADIDDVVDSVIPSFVGSDEVIIKSAIENYISIGAYASSPLMSEESFDRMIEIITFAGELDANADVDFEDVIDNTISQKVLSYFSMF